MTNEAIALFSDKDRPGDSEIIRIKTFEDYYTTGYNNYKGEHVKSYTELVEELTTKFPPDKEIVGEDAKAEFVELFGEAVKAQNILRVFDEYADDPSKQILSDLEMQDYKSKYLDIRDEVQKKVEVEHDDRGVVEGVSGCDGDEEPSGDETKDGEAGQTSRAPIVFELELLRQFDVDFDYILMLIGEYHEASEEERQSILDRIVRTIRASDTLRPKMDLIMEFIEKYDDSSKWQAFIQWRLDEDIKSVSADLGINAEATKNLLVNAFDMGRLVTAGPDFDKILPPMPLFVSEDSAVEAERKRSEAADKVMELYNRYRDDYTVEAEVV